ncbi:DctP family TRAP transporter solute-binding subunit [Guptibacillus algicola]|uniref:DctP family TRAP transporter solute-binding subunit n=1 Tax=Guptibacillus algicola TaxID=225844 RepID=UPI001CD4F01C|nr:DctP family TRAP transporter solute-binding subunit [Alkalihalobacillus algicola]MCA0988671.1 DctP family TRAP transporter solute-binding subunit [Alkalihalobacillus algicola]
MKTVTIITSFILAGILTAFFLGFSPVESTGKLEYDDEQEGLEEQLVIRFSHVAAENTPKGMAARDFAKRIQAKTDNEIKVEIYSNGELYQDQNEWAAVANGNVEMIAPATTKLSTRFPDWQVLDLPYAFQGYPAVQEAYEGKIGQTLLDDLRGTNVKGLGFWYNGFKQFTNNKQPIQSPSDMNKLHFRVMPGPVIEAQFQALNASTSELSFNKTYRNLEVGFVDGQENAISNIYSKKFYKQQSYMTLSNHAYLGYAVVINEEFFEGLSNTHQQSLTEAMKETTDWVRRHSIEINDAHIRKIKRSSDMEIDVLTTEEQKRWREAFKPVYLKAKQNISNELLQELERIQQTHSP